MILNMNHFVSVRVHKESDGSYRVSAYKTHPEFVEYEFQTFTNTEDNYRNDEAVMSYLDELYERYAYPYTT